MFYSMGNLLENARVGMLFIDFEKPHRLRLQGNAVVDDDDPLRLMYTSGTTGRSKGVIKQNAADYFSARGSLEYMRTRRGAALDRPDYYAEAYVPVVLNGSPVGVAEVYVDQSAKQSLYAAVFLTVQAISAGFVALAAAPPARDFRDGVIPGLFAIIALLAPRQFALVFGARRLDQRRQGGYIPPIPPPRKAGISGAKNHPSSPHRPSRMGRGSGGAHGGRIARLSASPH